MLTPEDRFLNLALINIGEAVAEIANLRQRGLPPGADYAVARLRLLSAIAATNGELRDQV